MKSPEPLIESRAKRPRSRRLVRVTVSLDMQDYAAFETLGQVDQLSRSWLIRKAMREYLERNRNHSEQVVSGI